MGQFVHLMFSFFLTKKSITFRKQKYHRKTGKKPNLSELTQILCDLLSLLFKYFRVKMKCNVAMLTVVSFAPVVWSPHTTPSISHLRESALRDKTK